MTYSVISRAARVQAGENGSVFAPRVINGSTRFPIIACHGATTTWSLFTDVTFLKLNQLLATAANNGIPSIAEHLGGDTWGNATGTARVNAALTAVAAETGCSASKAHLLGVSMGAAVSLAYAIANPTKVASLTLLIPATSVVNMYQKLESGQQANLGIPAGIAAAWGVAYRFVTDAVTNGTTTLTSATASFVAGDVGKLVISNPANGIVAGTTIASVTNGTTAIMSAAATTSGTGRIVGFGQTPLPPGADLLANIAPVVGIPCRIYYATADTTINSADVLAMASALGVTATAVSPGSHDNVGVLPAGFDYEGWADWLIANGG